jgi:hypothetical protein
MAIVLTAVVPWQATDRATVAADATSRFVPVGPVRLTDTRRSDCGCIRRTGSTIEIDVMGVFVPAQTAREGRFVSVAASRLVDTREPGPRALY